MSDPEPEPETHSALPTGAAAREEVLRARKGGRPMLFPNAYVWLLLFSALDIMLTWVILHMEGREVNPIAERIIDDYGLNGMIIYKFALITLFIVICETVGKLRLSTGKVLSLAGVLIALVPVAWSLLLLFRYGAQ